MLEAIVLLKNKIPGVLAIAVGETFTTARAQGYTHVLTVRLDSRQRLTEYDQHPGMQHCMCTVRFITDCLPAVPAAHQAVLKQFIRPIVEGACALDAECPR